MSDDATPYHEAGHAVARVALRKGFQYVTLQPRTPGTTGLLYAPNRSRYRLYAPADDDDVCTLSGALAEARRLWLTEGGSLSEIEVACVRAGTSRGDWQNIVSVGDVTAHVRFAHELLERNWQAVEAIAGALVKCRTLRARQVRELCGQVDERAALRGAGLETSREATWRFRREQGLTVATCPGCGQPFLRREGEETCVGCLVRAKKRAAAP